MLSWQGVLLTGALCAFLGLEQAQAVTLPDKPSVQLPGPASASMLQSFQIEAGRDELKQQLLPSICKSGSFTVSVQLLHALWPAGSRSLPTAAVIIRKAASKQDTASIEMSEVRNPMQEFFVLHQPGMSRSYSHPVIFGSPGTLLISWDATGLVTAAVGSEAHQAKLSGPPDEVLFSIYSGTAEFRHPVLSCTQSQ